MVILITIVVLALVFDYTNGFHDSANAIATSVSTRALSPRTAVLMAAGFNLFGALATSMATTGYENLKSFQKAEVMVAPALMTEGKKLQKEQDVGMG